MRFFSLRVAILLALVAFIAPDALAAGKTGKQSAPPAPAAPAPARTLADEAALFEKGRISAQQKALARLAVHPEPGAEKVLLKQFDRLDAGELPPAVWLELFEAAAKRNTPALKARLTAREQAVAKAPDPLARYRECLVGGDGEAGRALFTKKAEAGCVRCHTIEGVGAQIGPDLTWLRNSVERLHLLESLIMPNATVATGYAHALLKLTDGQEVAGVITFETSDDLTLTALADGKKRHVKIADIVERTSLPSPMPPHFGAVLSKREIRDLIEFLAAGD